MKASILLAATVAVLPLAACERSPSEKLADRVENAAEARADELENKADVLDARADQVREEGDERSDAIEAADRNVAAMSQAERDAVVANEAAAVR